MKAAGTSSWLSSAGGVLALLAPKGLCPVCVATSGTVLSSVGLGFLATDQVIRWVLPAVLLAGLAGLLLATRAHRRWWVLGAGVTGALVLYVGWWLASSPALYGGMVLLVAASAINFWARRHPRVPLVQIGIGGQHGKAQSGSVQRGMSGV